MKRKPVGSTRRRSRKSHTPSSVGGGVQGTPTTQLVSVSPAWTRLKAGPVEKPKPTTRYGVPIREDGCACKAPERTGHVPGCPYFPNAIYACEKGDKRTVVMLAKAAGLSVADMERKRLDFAGVDANCGDQCWPDRRRCWRCPFWKRYPEEHPL